MRPDPAKGDPVRCSIHGCWCEIRSVTEDTWDPDWFCPQCENGDVGLWLCKDCGSYFFVDRHGPSAGCEHCNSPDVTARITKYLPLTEGMFEVLSYLWSEHARSDLDLDENTEHLASLLGAGALFKDLLVIDPSPKRESAGGEQR